MNPDTSGDARAETDVRISPAAQPSETAKQLGIVPQSNGSPPVVKMEPAPDSNPAPIALPIPEAPADPTPPSDGPKTTPMQSTTSGALTNTAPVKKSETTPPALNAPQSQPKSLSVGPLNGKAITLPKPVYPDTARRMGIEGAVRVSLMIDERGRVVSAQAETGPALLRDAAVVAARQAKFTPSQVSGQPVRVSGFIIYNFKL
jgi:protein TonB